jgi:hypothetical protein
MTNDSVTTTPPIIEYFSQFIALHFNVLFAEENTRRSHETIIPAATTVHMNNVAQYTSS